MMWNKSNNGTECKLILNMTRFPIEIGKIRQVSVLVSLKMTFEQKLPPNNFKSRFLLCPLHFEES